MINSFGQYIGGSGSVRSSPSITSVGDGLNLSGKTLTLTFDPQKINNSFSFTRSPLNTDINDADGIQYKLGTLWINTTDHKVFVLTSNDGSSALWTELDDSQSVLPTLGTGILTSNNNVWSATGDINSLITNGTITNSKLANVSASNAGNSLVIRDSTGSTAVTNLKVTKIEPNSGTSVNINGWSFANGDGHENLSILDTNTNMWLNSPAVTYFKSVQSHVFKDNDIDTLYITPTIIDALVDINARTKLLTNEIKERSANAGVSFTSKIKLQTIDPVDALQPITINGNVAFSGTKEIVMGGSTDNSRIVIWDGRSPTGETSTNYYGIGHGLISTSNSDEIINTAGFNDGRSCFLLHSLSSANGFLFTQGSLALPSATKYQIQAGLRNKTFYIGTLNELFTDQGISCNSKLKINELAERTSSNGIIFNHKSKFNNGILTDGISERTLASGVSINHPLKCDEINERTLNNCIVFNHAIKCDEIKEKTASNGVIINSALKLPNISNGYLSINNGVVTSSSGPSINNDVIQSSTTVAPALYTSDDKLAFYYDSTNSNLFVANRQTLPSQNTLTGTNNIGIGYSSLYKLTTGSNNICVGASAGFQYTTSYQNVMIGHNTNSSANGTSNSVVIGTSCAPYMTGQFNTIVGDTSATALTTGYSNLLMGYQSAKKVTTGNNNTILGSNSASESVSSSDNTFIGYRSAYYNTGSANVMIGSSAGEGTGAWAGSNNVIIGQNAGSSYNTTNNKNILIGSNLAGNAVDGTSSTSNKGVIRIGNPTDIYDCFISGITGRSIDGPNVTCDTSGHIGISASSLRFKTDVVDMGDTSFIYNLRPRKFYMKDDVNKKNIQYGLIAEEVNDVHSDLVFMDDKNEPLALRDKFFPYILLNEMKKLKQENDILKQSVDELKNFVMEMRTEINELKTKNNVHFERMTPSTINDGEMKFYEITNGHLICKWKNGNIIKELDLIS